MTIIQRALPIAVAATLAVVSGFAPPTSGPRTAEAQTRVDAPRPSLVVLLVVDQMRADYVNRFRGDWTGGLKRMLDHGAWFSRAAFPFMNTATCAGHATVSTGTFPRVHGIIQNAWYDRGTRRQVTCTADATARALGYGVEPVGGDSGHRLLVPTFADRMREQLGSRVVSLSLKARSAIMLAGRHGEAVTWLTSSLDGWQTSTAFSAAPVPAVQQFVDAAPIAADYGKSWTLRLPASRYQGVDAGEKEDPPAGWTASFPHVLAGSGKRPDQAFYEQWQHSPFADAYLGRFAAALVESLQLGKRGSPDILGIGFSSPDTAGHAFGPSSREVQDIFARLDDTLGILFERLDALLGRDGYVVALTADHGVAPIPEQLRRTGASGGRLSASKLHDLIEEAAQGAGPGKYVVRVSGAVNEVYFEPGMYDRLRSQPAVMDTVMKRLGDQPGIARVFRRDELGDAAGTSDRLRRSAALGYVPERSGDLILAPASGWTFASSGTSHGTANDYDQQVPVILMGPRIKAGEYREAATPADLAPTLAALMGVAMPAVDGRVLGSALVGTRGETQGSQSPARAAP
jgi:predicted AlkP superfamily pyrophosphatase or phosphodiesterase